MTAARTPREVSAEIIAGLSIADEYRALGVEIVGNARSSGMVSCRAWGREDRRPSAWISVRTGYYGDVGGKDAAAATMSLFDFAVKVGKFSDWKEARRFYANKVGVDVGRTKKSDEVDWRLRLDFQDWATTPGNDVLALRWCVQAKPGVSVEAIKAAGGILAYYPCWIDRNTKERKRGSRQVIAIPAYGEWFLNADPAAWIIWDVTGSPFDVTPKDHPKDQPRITAKMLSIGKTSGATLGLSALMLLNDPDARQQIERVWIVEGPSDLLTLWSVIPEADRGRHIVLSKAGGATADVMPWQSKLLAGLNVAIVGDADEAGQVGALKWCYALADVAAEVRIVSLPWKVEPSHGKDVRDYLIGESLPGEAPTV
jgi:hypothetical protein